MTPIYALAAAAIVACAIHMILSRNLVRILLGLALLSTGVNLALFVAGGIASRQPPLIADDAKTLGPSADPVAQALILTAIVIGFALTVILAAIVLRGRRTMRSLDARDLNARDQPDEPEPVEPAA